MGWVRLVNEALVSKTCPRSAFQEAIGLLERNERLVTWLMPANGSIKDQIAAIRFRGHFFTLSLRFLHSVSLGSALVCVW